jgi:hypothetical protein
MATMLWRCEGNFEPLPSVSVLNTPFFSRLSSFSLKAAKAAVSSGISGTTLILLLEPMSLPLLLLLPLLRLRLRASHIAIRSLVLALLSLLADGVATSPLRSETALPALSHPVSLVRPLSTSTSASTCWRRFRALARSIGDGDFGRRGVIGATLGLATSSMLFLRDADWDTDITENLLGVGS